MKDFRLFDIADFVMDEDFIRWVQHRSPSDELFWLRWLEQSPSKHLVVAEARQIVESIHLERKIIPPADIDAEIAKLLHTIDSGKKKPETVRSLKLTVSSSRWLTISSSRWLTISPSRWLTVSPSRWLTVAALFLLVIADTPFLLQHHQQREQTPSPITASFFHKVNDSSQPVSFTLPDRSTILLAAHSSISYPQQFSTALTRDIYLSGEAFFKINKDPARPFRVLTGDIITKVLGTSFSVRSYEADSIIRITVKTGRVSVGNIIVSCNQQLIYQRPARKFQKALVEKPLFIVPDTLDRNMVYEDKPIDQVFGQLGRYYGIGIVYDSELLSKCTVTADLTNEPFYRKLDLICKAIGASYEIVDAQVVIQGSGCQ